MFADIEGYTRLFQQNEQAAMELSGRHRDDLQRIIPAHNGKLVQSYGDGSVSVYDSVVDAVQCAVALQAASRMHAVPLRIGIHLGDLVFQDNDIFGDAVNIASRIQSEGVAGAILVSEKVAGELRNHPAVRLHALGLFRLKNVSQPMALYAVEGQDIVIPPHASPVRYVTRSLAGRYGLMIGLVLAAAAAYWILRNPPGQRIDWSQERIAIAPFENLTGDTSLANLPGQIYAHLTYALEQGTVLNVESAKAGILWSGGDLSRLLDPAFVLKNGCRFTVRGTINPYGSGADSVMILASVFDCKRREILEPKLRPVIFARQEQTAGLSKLTDVVKGYWESRDTLPVSAPLFNAYVDYLRALQAWGGRNLSAGKPFLLRAIEKDSTFFEAHLMLLDCFYNINDCKGAKDTLALIHRRFPSPTPEQLQYLNFYHLDLDGERKRAWDAFTPILANKPEDLFNATSAMVMALDYRNDPDGAIRIMNKIANPDHVLQTCSYCLTYMINGIRAYTETGQFDKAAPWVERVKAHVRRDAHFAILAGYYIAANRPDDLASWLADLLARQTNDTLRAEDEAAYAYLAAVMAKRYDQPELFIHYVKRALTAYQESDYPGRTGTCLLLAGDPAAAVAYYKAELAKPGTAGNADRLNRFRSELGIAYARSGERQLANEMLQLLITAPVPPCDYGIWEYHIGRLKANLGDPQGALDDLKRSLDRGYYFALGQTFGYDPFLDVLADNKAYQDLVKSRL